MQITEDNISKYLEETREYIEKLKNDLIRKILIQQKTQGDKKIFDRLQFK